MDIYLSFALARLTTFLGLTDQAFDSVVFPSLYTLCLYNFIDVYHCWDATVYSIPWDDYNALHASKVGQNLMKCNTIDIHGDI